MTAVASSRCLDMAAMPLGDGRQIILPLLALAEVRQLRLPVSGQEEGFGTLHWRGQELAIGSLDEFCGLAPQAREMHTTVGVFRGSKEDAASFRALAFCGLAGHLRVSRDQVQSLDIPAEGHFAAAAEIDGKVYLVPDFERLLYSTFAPAATP